jgi:hypothetical protein
MRRHGVAGAISLSTRGLYYGASAGNRETAALCQQSGSTLQPAAILDPRIPVSAQAVAGARLFCLMPASQHWPLPFAPLNDLLSALAQAGSKTPIFWEATRLGDATRIREAVTLAGCTNPMLLGSVSGDSLIEAIAVARGDDRFGVVTDGLRGIGEVAMVVAALGASRVYFGSGAPVHSLGGALAVVRRSGLSEGDMELVIGGNTKRLIATGGAAA